MEIRYLKLEPKVPNPHRITCILVIEDDGTDHPPYNAYYIRGDDGRWDHHLRPPSITDWVYNSRSWQKNDYKITPMTKEEVLIDLL